MQTKTKAIIYNVLGLAFCVVPPAIATLEHFPIWAAKGGEAILSGLTVILLVLCALPFKRQISEYLKSPSAWMMWLCILVFSLLFSRIADDVSRIALVAFPSNLLGAFLFKKRDKYKEQ